MGVAVATAALCAGTLQAQTSNGTGTAVAPQGGLQDIIVTARKRAESIQNIPVAVTAITPAQLSRYNITSLDQVAASTPQLVVGRANTGSGAQLSIRGISGNFSSVGIEQSVAVIVDGSYYSSGRVINEGFFDLGSLEILKGPQALFFGKNATAGAVSITTADPTSKTEIMLRGGYEVNARQVYGEAIYSTPLTDTLGIRVALRGSKMFGNLVSNRYGTGDFYPTTDFSTGITAEHAVPAGQKNLDAQKQFLGRVTLKWTPADDLTVTLKGYGDTTRQNSVDALVTAVCPDGNTVRQLNPSLPCQRAFVTYEAAIPADMAADLNGVGHIPKNGRDYSNYDSYAVNAKVEYNISNINITDVANFNYNKYAYANTSQFAPAGFVDAFSGDAGHTRAFSNELRALTQYDGPINLLVGGYYQHTNFHYSQYAIFYGLEDSSAPANKRYCAYCDKLSSTIGETEAVYAQLIWKVLPKLELTAGARYTHETKDSTYTFDYINPVLTIPSVGGGAWTDGFYFAPKQTFNNWSPEVVLTWRPTSDVTVFGGYKTGYKSGGFSNSTNAGTVEIAQDALFKPETVKGFEGGIKAILLDHQLRTSLVGYSYLYSNLQVDFYNGNTRAFTTVNAGQTRIRGLEFDAEFAPRSIPGLDLHGSINYNHARYQNFIGPCYVGQSLADGCVYADRFGALPTGTQVPVFQNLSGKAPASAPTWTASLGFNYDHPINDAWSWGLSTDARYSSHYRASPFNNPVGEQHKYVNIDASARIRSADNHWELAVIGRNLTDRFIITTVNSIPGSGGGTGTSAGVLGDQQVSIEPPRTVAFQVTWKY